MIGKGLNKYWITGWVTGQETQTHIEGHGSNLAGVVRAACRGDGALWRGHIPCWKYAVSLCFTIQFPFTCFHQGMAEEFKEVDMGYLQKEIQDSSHQLTGSNDSNTLWQEKRQKQKTEKHFLQEGLSETRHLGKWQLIRNSYSNYSTTRQTHTWL